MKADGISNITVSRSDCGSKLVVKEPETLTEAELDTNTGGIVLYVGGDFKMGVCFDEGFLGAVVGVLSRIREELSKHAG